VEEVDLEFKEMFGKDMDCSAWDREMDDIELVV